MHQKNNTNLDLGKTLKLLRVNRYTQKELAGKLHISQQAISRWEKGSVLPDFSNLVKISELYNVSLKELIDTVPAASMPSDWPTKYEEWESARVQALTTTMSEASDCTEDGSESLNFKAEHSEASVCEEEHSETPDCTDTVTETPDCTDTVFDCTEEQTEASDCTSEHSDGSDQKKTAFGTAFPKGKWYNFFYFVATGLILFSSIYLFYVGFPLCVCYFVFHRKLPVKSRLLDILAVICLGINIFSLYTFLDYTFFHFGNSSVTPVSYISDTFICPLSMILRTPVL